MSSVIRYEIFCVTEQTFVQSWGITPPTKCPNDTSHEINLDSVNRVGSVSEDKVTINNEFVPPGAISTSGYYKCDCIIVTCAPSTTTVYDTAIPFPICINTVQFAISQENCGDTVTIIGAPNTLLCPNDTEVLSGSNTITVPSVIAPYLIKGFYFKLKDDVTNPSNPVVEDLLQIISCVPVDANHVTVTTVGSTVANFPVGSKILMERRTINNFYMNVPGTQIFGGAILGSSYVPADAVTRIIYVNNTNVEKKFVMYYEYYF